MSDLAYACDIGFCINVSKTKVMLALIPGEQCQAALLDGEPLEDVRRTEEIKINLVRSSFCL